MAFSICLNKKKPLGAYQEPRSFEENSALLDNSATQRAQMPIRFYPSIEHYYSNEFIDTTITQLYEEKVGAFEKKLQFDVDDIGLNERVIEYIESCETKQSINELFYKLFGKKHLAPFNSYLAISNLDNEFELEDYKILAKKAYQEWTTENINFDEEREPSELNEFQFPQKTVYATHGGGLRFILSFLQGFQRGYPMIITRQKGIYVSPNKDPLFDISSPEKILNERDEHYAYSTSYWKYLDTPAILKFKTNRSNLKQEDRAYEACLTADSVVNIEDIELIALSDTKKLYPHMPVISPYSRKTEDTTPFARRIDESIQRVKKLALRGMRQQTLRRRLRY